MNIVVVNPNVTASMTRSISVAAQRAAAPDTTIIAVEPRTGPEAIEGPFDGALAVPPMLKTMASCVAEADAYVIACFDDTGLDAARALTNRPVVGIGEAAFHAVNLVAHSFCIITTLARSVPIIEDNVRRYGFGHRCRKVFATDIPVLKLERADSGAAAKISEHIQAAKALGAEGIALGCAGMAEFAHSLQQQHGLPVIDGVGAAVGLAEMLVRNRLSTSKTGVWAPPDRAHLLH